MIIIKSHHQAAADGRNLTPLYWVAVKELKLSYHDVYIIYHDVYIYSSYVIWFHIVT